MEPRIQYAKTSDGVNIAYSVMGEGVPMVHMPDLPLSHLQREWQLPEIRRWCERIAETRMLVKYDSRGTGLSDRDVTDFSLDQRMLDLEAVVDRLDFERFSLYGALHSAPVAIAYAARHAQRVSRLVLWCAFARGSDFSKSPTVALVRALANDDWPTFTETASAALATGWEAGEFAHRVAALYRESITQKAFQAFIRSADEVDVTELLSKVTSPTLVLQPRGFDLLSVDVASGLAARIPDARLTVLERGGAFAHLGDPEAAATAIDDFLGDGQGARVRERTLPSVVVTPAPSGLAIVLFTDIVDSTALTERLGDATFRDKARDLDAALRNVIRNHAGTPIEGKLLGDGVLATFASARHGIEAAIACGAAGASAGLPLHLGLHAGDVIREEDNVFGGAVNIASRISGLSAPGEVLVSHTVRDLARTSAGVTFEDRGEHALKGVGEPVRVWAVRAAQ